MTLVGERVDAGRRERDALLAGLDLLRDADDHGSPLVWGSATTRLSSLMLALLSGAPTVSGAALMVPPFSALRVGVGERAGSVSAGSVREEPVCLRRLHQVRGAEEPVLPGA